MSTVSSSVPSFLKKLGRLAFESRVASKVIRDNKIAKANRAKSFAISRNIKSKQEKAAAKEAAKQEKAAAKEAAKQEKAAAKEAAKQEKANTNAAANGGGNTKKAKSKKKMNDDNSRVDIIKTLCDNIKKQSSTSSQQPAQTI